MKAAIGIDLGGTRIKAVAIDADGNILHQLYKPTNDGETKVWKNTVAEAVKELQNILVISQKIYGYLQMTAELIVCLPDKV